jgi:hypothetical protein|tara:strand:+ start:140 stop:274 length:135 start_codon:yes stop_codon:yes gene_type:complete
MDKCDLCHKSVDERSTQEQSGFTLCLTCHGYYSDEEIKEKMETQ